MSEQLSLEPGDTTAEVGDTASGLVFPPTQDCPGVPAGPCPSLSCTTWETQINPQVFRLGHGEKFPCLQLTWEMELLLFSSDTCPCTQRKGLQGGLLADVVSELALREVRGPLPPALPRRVVTCWDTQCLESFSALPSPTSTRKFLQLPPSLLLRR